MKATRQYLNVMLFSMLFIMQTEEHVLLAVQAASIFYYAVDEILKVDHDQLTIQLNATEQYYQSCMFVRLFFNIF